MKGLTTLANKDTSVAIGIYVAGNYTSNGEPVDMLENSKRAQGS